MSDKMTSMDRVLTALDHEVPDQVPLLLFLTTHGAKELNLSIKEYFSNPENVIEAQLILREKYNNDCVNPFYYSSIELEAWGGKTIFFEDGPPNAGPPVIKSPQEIESLEVPSIEEAEGLQRVIKTIEGLKEEVQEEVPILGTIVSPFSLPIMQMGFSHYLDLIYDEPDLFEKLMEKNEEFSANWANAQLKAGATAIGYADPMSSPSMIPRELFLKTGFQIASRMSENIDGDMAIHLASGRTLSIIDDLKKTGILMVGISAHEDLSKLKEKCGKDLAILGNLNGIEMCRWRPDQAEQAVKRCIAQAAEGGGFILSDNHGEIPYQVQESVLNAIKNAVEKWGKYPLDWI